MKDDIIKELHSSLFALQDIEYRAFHSKLMPTVNPETVIGIRTPALRRFAREFAKSEAVSAFMGNLPHSYYEENNLHAFLIEAIGDFEKTVTALDLFLPYVDNWATCDMMSPKIFANHKAQLLPFIEKWLASDHVYTARFALVMLMKHYLDEDFSPVYLEKACAVASDSYYIEMAKAWFFAEALVKQYESAFPYLSGKKLSPWVHNKTISKACDSFRISNEKKNILRALRLKKIERTQKYD